MSRIFELRTYEAVPGKIEQLKARFRDHTLGIFAKHDMEVVAFWEVDDANATADILVYVLAFDSREAADKAWNAFSHDPEWLAVKSETESHGPIVASMDSLFMKETDFAPKS